ncbi:MAG TPA: D-aminoacyl-tRNA deacylase [Abditibacteriaceae bacterium]|jgi:D-tyrosyl-tRNA(Tyr) deacylase
MKAVIQRCHRAQVEVEGKIVGQIGPGLAVFLGVAKADDESAAEKLTRKIASLRIFNDDEGKFNRSLLDTGGSALVISNFTLYGDARKGTRPNFMEAAAPDEANRLYEAFVTLLRNQNVPVETGVFAANMKVLVENDGPVTIILEA